MVSAFGIQQGISRYTAIGAYRALGGIARKGIISREIGKVRARRGRGQGVIGIPSNIRKSINMLLRGIY